MKASNEKRFERNYALHLQHLKLKGRQPKTVEAYSRVIRRIGEYFDGRIDALSEQQLTGYFTDLVTSHSWSAVKFDLYGLKFYYTHVLRKPWVAPDLIKPPKPVGRKSRRRYPPYDGRIHANEFAICPRTNCNPDLTNRHSAECASLFRPTRGESAATSIRLLQCQDSLGEPGSRTASRL